jgi:hypothetical protein
LQPSVVGAAETKEETRAKRVADLKKVRATILLFDLLVGTVVCNEEKKLLKWTSLYTLFA